MSTLKNAGASFFGTIFTLLLATIIFMVPVINLTAHDSAKDVFMNTFTKTIPQNQSAQALTFLKLQCSMGKTDTITLPMQEQNVTLSCVEINKANDTTELYTVIGAKIFDDLYNKQYNCSFINCIRSGQQTVFFSEYGHESLKSMLNYAYFALAISAVLLLICSDIPFGAMRNFGVSMIFVGVSYFFIGLTDSITAKLFVKLPAQVVESVKGVMDGIFSYAAEKLLLVLIIGIVLAVIGFVGGFFFKPKKAPVKKK